MPIPPFNISGVLPPYLGFTAGGQASHMSPYRATTTEVITQFDYSLPRRDILAGWLSYRIALRQIGINRGFQWLDGSFLEDKERLIGQPPNDLDIVVFVKRPARMRTNPMFRHFINANAALFDRSRVRASFLLDAFWIDLNGDPSVSVDAARYYLQLFSHQRAGLWKGMVQVRQDDSANDRALLAALRAHAQGATP